MGLQHLAAAAALDPAAPAPAREVAARLLGFVDARLASLGAPRMDTEQREYEQAAGALRASLGAAQFDRLLAAGAALTDDEALARARTVSE